MARPRIVINGKEYPIVFPDEKWRIVIPREIRNKISCDAFVVMLTEDGKIILDPFYIKR